MQKTLASLANPRQFVETLMDPRASRLIGAFHADPDLLPKSASCGAERHCTDGEPDAGTVFPTYHRIDYVRVARAVTPASE